MKTAPKPSKLKEADEKPSPVKLSGKKSRQKLGRSLGRKIRCVFVKKNLFSEHKCTNISISLEFFRQCFKVKV